MEYSSVDLSWLPSDADEQLALGFRVISNAYKTRVTTLEAEIRSARSVVSEKAEHLSAVQKKFSSLEVQLIEATQRGNQLAEENRNLVAAITKLKRDIDRLESLRKAVLCSIQDDKAEPDQEKRFYNTEDLLHHIAPRTMMEIKEGGFNDVKYAHKVRTAPISTSGITTPHSTFITTDRDTVDGRAFFKAAKAKMPSENFHELVALVKRFNNQTHSREETILHAKRLINDDRLLEDFKQLLA